MIRTLVFRLRRRLSVNLRLPLPGQHGEEVPALRIRRRSARGRPRRARRAPILAALTFAVAAALAGCQSRASAAKPPETMCGITRTAAGVPVEIEVKGGHTSCSTALAVERAYVHALASGKVPGNGGGAPVRVRGWMCQGFNTPELLHTGNTSACRRGGAEILAVLASPSATPSP